jgi:hypothetical protein
MVRRLAAAALLPVVLLLAGPAHAAEPEFTVARVVESREYEREKGSVAIAGVRTAAATEWTNRVTVVLEGTRITGEWVAKTTRIPTAKDFPRGADVTVAINRNRLLLKDAEGSIVTAKIVRRVEQQESARRD